MAARASASGSSSRALVVGDPQFYNPRLQLPGARIEASAVMNLLSRRCGGSAGVTLLEREKATKKAVTETMRECEYVHLATHGTAQGVLLAGSTEEAGLLTMGEVQNLELRRAHVVVLSECDSFKGQLRADGVIGIARAFVAAGAPTLLASLWKVCTAHH